MDIGFAGALVWAAVGVGTLAMTTSLEAAPKRVLVVTTTTGFRHSSIPTAEKVLGELAKETKAFTVDYARVEPNDPQFRGADGKPDKAKVEAAIKAVLAEKMNPEALKNYDAVIFANTTGDLPLPDRQAFLDWIKSGKGFVGMHSATDTFHGFPAYIEMIGGEFKTHGAQVEVEGINQDQECPACRHLAATWKVYDEIYQFKNFDRSKVHGLLTLDRHPNDTTPGDYPLSWCKEYGDAAPAQNEYHTTTDEKGAYKLLTGLKPAPVKGRVFYTSLGHREDIWDPNTPADFKRMNSKEIAEAYQKHILSGIRWAVGLERWNLEPQRGRVE